MIIYTERDTTRLYEVQMFENFALIRPMTIGYQSEPEKVSIDEFEKRFDEFAGDSKILYERLEASADILGLESFA